MYFSTFASGLERPIGDFLKKDIPKVKILRLLDGAALYETPADVTELRYLNNTFRVLKLGFGWTPERLAAEAMKTGVSISARTFKVFTSMENRLSPLGGRLTYRLIETLEAKTGARYDARRAAAEFWLLVRREGISLFMLRLTGNRRKPAAGELRPELAHVLVRLSRPASDDVFVDLFAGSGALPMERARVKPFKGIFALDRDENLARVLKEKARRIKSAKMRRSFFVKVRDALANGLDDCMADAVVTDPPWGLFAPIEADFYPRFWDECARLLKPGGRLVALMARHLSPAEIPGFRITERCDILVSGQKASVIAADRA